MLLKYKTVEDCRLPLSLHLILPLALSLILYWWRKSSKTGDCEPAEREKTVVMIAHTLSIVKNADQILVVSDGRITEAGTHKELLEKEGKYAAMWNAEQQLSA